MLNVPDSPSQVWGEGERPNWLVPDELQPKKREWSPARDRIEAELELKARLLDQKHLRRRNRLRLFILPFIWTWSLIQALVAVGRNQPEVVERPRPEAPTHSGAASLDLLPSIRPQAPAEEKASGPVIGWAPPPTEPDQPITYETPATAEPVAPPAPAPRADPTIEWPDAVEPAPPPPAPGPQAPSKDWRPHVAPVVPEAGEKAAPPLEPPPPPTPLPPTHWPGDEPGAEAPATAAPAEPAATEAPAPPLEWAPAVPVAAVPAPAPIPPTTPPPLPPQPTQQLGAGELLGVFLGTCMRSAAAEVGVLVLLQDDVLVVRASSGVEGDTASHLALETLGDLCLDVIGSGVPVRHYEANPGPPDPYHPRAILCVPVMIAGSGTGAVLLAGYAPGREFTPVHERLAFNLSRTAGPVLARAGAYKLALDRPGDRWRRLDQVGSAAPPAAAPAPPITEHGTGEITGSPMSTMTLDPEAMRKLIAGAKAARSAQEAEAAAEAEAEEQAALAAEAARRPPPAPVLEPEEEPPAWRLPDWEKPAAAGAAEEQPIGETQVLPPPALEPVEPAAPQPKKPGWRDRVGSRMTRISEQREEDKVRYHAEILAAVRNLSWDGYQALIADIYRRKAFEVFPPPVSGSDLDVIDLVVDRDGKRMLINCQLRGEMDIPAAAVTEMGNVVANYSVAGAYLIADGSFAPDAAEAAAANGVVLIDGEALIDLVIETTLKDESKPSGFGRIAQRFKRAS
jgi:Restriction endonuclease/GAF domain